MDFRGTIILALILILSTVVFATAPAYNLNLTASNYSPQLGDTVTIQGIVLSDSNVPLADANVLLVGKYFSVITITDSNGIFRVNYVVQDLGIQAFTATVTSDSITVGPQSLELDVWTNFSPTAVLTTTPALANSNGWFNGPVTVNISADPGIPSSGDCILPNDGNVTYSPPIACTFNGNLGGTDSLHMVTVNKSAQILIESPQDGSQFYFYNNGWNVSTYDGIDAGWGPALPKINPGQGFIIHNMDGNPTTIVLADGNSEAQARYCVDLLNRSDGCRIYNPDWNANHSLPRIINKDPADYNIFTNDLNINFDGNTAIKYYASNGRGAMSAITTAYIPIDSVGPQSGFNIGYSPSIGAFCSYGGGVEYCDLNWGLLIMPSVNPANNKPWMWNSDTGSGVDYCEFNFNYNTTPDVWEYQVPESELVPSVVYYYKTTGDKVVALKCTDKAGNSTTSFSNQPHNGLPAVTIRVNNTVNASLGLTVNPAPVVKGNSFIADVNLANVDNNFVSAMTITAQGNGISISLPADYNSATGLWEAVFDTNSDWPAGDYNITSTALMLNGQSVDNTFIITVSAPVVTPVDQPNGGGTIVGRGSAIVTTPDINKPLDLNKPIDTNKPLDVNAPNVDNNKPIDLNKPVDTNTLGINSLSNTGANTAPATGLFGLFGAGSGGSSWIVPILIIILALFIIALWIRRENLGAEAASSEAKPKKKWESK